MRLLLFDTTAYYPSSPLFLEALQELSAKEPRRVRYAFIDEARFQGGPRSLAARIARRLLCRDPIDRSALYRTFLSQAKSFRPDLVLICKGGSILPETLAKIKQSTGAMLVNYATDDPLNPRVSTRDLIEAIPLYDLYACTKRTIMADVAKAGCPHVVYMPFAYKPTVHFPEPPETVEEHRRFDSDVAFIGGCDRDRVPFFRALVKAMPDLKLVLYGSFWNRSLSLRPYWRGLALGRDFRMALGGTKIAINLVRRTNRDGHVMRSFEIPACGGFMLAERTDEHLELFSEGEEAAYFGSPEEMIDMIRYYLGHESERQRIKDAGRRKVTSGKHAYADRLIEIVHAVERSRDVYQAQDGTR